MDERREQEKDLEGRKSDTKVWTSEEIKRERKMNREGETVRGNGVNKCRVKGGKETEMTREERLQRKQKGDKATTIS